MLSIKDTMTLDLERSWWKHPGAKDATIRDLFGESSTRYYQRLSRLLDDPEAEAHDPMTVRRLQRLRDQRRARRRVGCEGRCAYVHM